MFRLYNIKIFIELAVRRELVYDENGGAARRRRQAHTPKENRKTRPESAAVAEPSRVCAFKGALGTPERKWLNETFTLTERLPD